jgi:hypothetical protein
VIVRAPTPLGVDGHEHPFVLKTASFTHGEPEQPRVEVIGIEHEVHTRALRISAVGSDPSHALRRHHETEQQDGELTTRNSAPVTFHLWLTRCH